MNCCHHLSTIFVIRHPFVYFHTFDIASKTIGPVLAKKGKGVLGRSSSKMGSPTFKYVFFTTEMHACHITCLILGVTFKSPLKKPK